ncbi:MAG: MmgE/PrpD family protein [Pseudomonadota bacterium]
MRKRVDRSAHSESLSQNPLDEIANWLADQPLEWPQEAYEVAENALIDTVACMIAGAPQPNMQNLTRLVSSWGKGPSTVIGHAHSLSSPWAALVNGAAAHALDYDDNFDPAKAHASAVLVPALIAVGEEEDLSVGALLDAYIAGLQVMGHVGQAVNPFHRNRGWHATATMGAIGVAAGCARLLGLDAEKCAHAVSMSTSRAGGFMSQFGTDTKPLHAGFAASGGVQSALMARAGLSAGSKTLDGPHSLRALMVGPDVEERAAEMIGRDEHGQSTSFVSGRVAEPLQILANGLKVKRFPNCGSTHRALDGLLALREKHKLSAKNVERVLIRAPGSHLRNLPYADPMTPNEAKFSLEYNCAVALEQGSVGLSDFTPHAIARPSIRALFAKIDKEPVEKLESEFPTEVSVRTVSGQTFNTHIEMPVGSRTVPLSREQLFEKLADCCAQGDPSLPTEDLSAFLQTIDRDAKISQLTRCLKSTGNAPIS